VYCGLRDEIVLMNCRVRKGEHWVIEKTVGAEVNFFRRRVENRVVDIEMWGKSVLRL
jgi:hypothetical protein